ncbi:MAG: hypothetical protein N4A71_16050 [Carboxylicivirga sp.]|jgi:hypothetical protein|nr:hypothetical protein [Carboxylicivirga sp.]
MTKLSYLLLLSVFIAACGLGNKKHEETNLKLNASAIASSQTTNKTTIYLNDANNVSLGEITIGTDVFINLKDTHIYRKIGSSGKAKYINKQGKVLAKINVYDDAIKLKKENGELLYKVKTYESKLKVAVDNEMTNPFEVKSKHSQLFKVYHQGNEMGSVIFEGQRASIETGNTRINAVKPLQGKSTIKSQINSYLSWFCFEFSLT